MSAVAALMLIKEILHTVESYGGNSSTFTNSEIMKMIKNSSSKDDLMKTVIKKTAKRRKNIGKNKYTIALNKRFGG